MTKLKFKRILTAGVSFLAFVLVSSTHAASLIEVYYQALKNDPTFKQARNVWLAARQNFPIARSGYLPALSLTANAERAYQKTLPVITTINENGYAFSHGYSVSLTQPLFNYQVWKSMQSQKASVKAATATFAAAAQDLMVRTTKAYFLVLQAWDKLRYTKANTRAVLQQLITAQQQFNVGLISITGVYDAQSVYDNSIAAEITDLNSLDNRIEDLRAITGQYYRVLNGIRRLVPLVAPRPNNIDAWVKTAERQNYSIVAQKYTVISNREAIDQAAAGAMPELDAVASYTASRGADFDNNSNTFDRTAMAGVQLTFTPFQGGLVVANTRQARYNYLAASDQLEFVHRSVIATTRQSFLGVVTGIHQIKADGQAIVSSRNALKATQAGYDVGTRTMVDVLDDLATVFRAEQNRADDQYIYLASIIDLKAAAGTLCADDVKKLSDWLSQPIKMPKQIKSYRPGLIKRYKTNLPSLLVGGAFDSGADLSVPEGQLPDSSIPARPVNPTQQTQPALPTTPGSTMPQSTTPDTSVGGSKKPGETLYDREIKKYLDKTNRHLDTTPSSPSTTPKSNGSSSKQPSTTPSTTPKKESTTSQPTTKKLVPVKIIPQPKSIKPSTTAPSTSPKVKSNISQPKSTKPSTTTPSTTPKVKSNISQPKTKELVPVKIIPQPKPSQPSTITPSTTPNVKSVVPSQSPSVKSTTPKPKKKVMIPTSPQKNEPNANSESQLRENSNSVVGSVMNEYDREIESGLKKKNKNKKQNSSSIKKSSSKRASNTKRRSKRASAKNKKKRLKKLPAPKFTRTSLLDIPEPKMTFLPKPRRT